MTDGLSRKALALLNQSKPTADAGYRGRGVGMTEEIHKAIASDKAEELRIAIEKDKPRPYDLTNPSEVKRLHREVLGYLKTCHQKHGTDWEGRKFAIDALVAISKAVPATKGSPQEPTKGGE